MNQIRLDEVLARNTDVQWFEGVAVLQLICRAWRAQGMEDLRFPSAADVVLAPGGTVAVTGATPGNAVQAAAHLLARMLSDDVPVRLRLAVSQATAIGGAYRSVATFSDELTYFERPNPEAIVDGVRQRALLASPLAVAATPPSLETPAVEKKRPASPAAVPTHRLRRLAIVAAAVSAVVCATAWGIGRAKIRTFMPAPAIAERAEPPVSDVVARARGGSHAASVSASGIFAAAPRRTGKTSRVPTAEIESTTDLLIFGQLPSHSYLDRIGMIDARPLIGMAGPVRALPSGRAPNDDEGTRIYTRDDPEVTLPLNVYPKFPTQSAAPDASRRTVLELTIAKDGTVEEVKMLTAPRNIHEFMLLSAVKAWRFEPARIGGHAIRFRHSLILDAASMGWVGAEQ